LKKVVGRTYTSFPIVNCPRKQIEVQHVPISGKCYTSNVGFSQLDAFGDFAFTELVHLLHGLPVLTVIKKLDCFFVAQIMNLPLALHVDVSG
jgi:hypothetical protein